MTVSVTRSTTITKARAKILQGASDSFWSNEHWNDFFHTACEMVHKEIVDASLAFFVYSGYVITKNASDKYPLPSDFYSIIRLYDASDTLYPRNQKEVDGNFQGFVLENNDIVLKNLSSLPATITLDYVQTIKEMGTWAGTVDSTADSTYEPDIPFNTKSGERLISEIIVSLAKSRDQSLDAASLAFVEQMIATFVNKLEGRIQNNPELLGYRYK